MLFIYMYISSIWRNKSWNQKNQNYTSTIDHCSTLTLFFVLFAVTELVGKCEIFDNIKEILEMVGDDNRK